MHQQPLRAGALAAVFLGATALLAPAVAATGGKDVGAEDAPAEFTPEFLADDGVVRRGKKIWGKTCKLCHGNTAYPGKAPKLGTKCYEPEFIYDRVTNGFQAMPAWKSQIEKSDRMSVSAYIVSNRFASTCAR